MVEKNRKLQNQFDAEASSSSHSASTSGRLIFQGVSIFVDGFTIPSSQVCFLHRIVFLSYVWLQGDLSIKISKSKNKCLCFMVLIHCVKRLDVPSSFHFFS